MRDTNNQASQDGKGILNRVVKVFRRDELASEQALDLELVRDVYEDAIAVGVKESEDGGRALALCIMMWFPGIPFAIWAVAEMWQQEGYISSIIMSIFSGGVVLGVGFIVLLFELFRPLSNSILFDRKHRRVCIRTIDVSNGLFRGRKAGETECYDWDQIEVQHRAQLNVTGASAFRAHYLILKVPNPKHPELELLPLGILTEQSAPAFYEFLRQYMEENGPPLTQGDSVEPSGIPQSWADSVRMATPFGPNYARWTRGDASYTLGLYLLFPLALIYYAVRVCCHQLVFRTAIKVDWSPEVQAEIGEPLGPEALKAWMAEHYPRKEKEAPRELRGRKARYRSRLQ